MLKIKIETKNSAFEENGIASEIEECFKDIILRLNHGFNEGNIHDTNGNVTGNFKLTNR